MTFKGRGGPGSSRITIPYNDPDRKNEDIIQGTYELKNLIMIGRCYTICKKMDICMKNKFPLIIKLSMESFGVIYFLCTPSKIKSE